MDFEKYASIRTELFNQHLAHQLNAFKQRCSNRFHPLIESMRYSLESNGKRIRPLLCMASAEALEIPNETILNACLALEFIHTYSLIHDDLPALDNDDMRRGKPSSHKQFGEATAILAGDALLTEAFSHLIALTENPTFKPSHVLATIEFLTQACGVRGLVGGQYLDLHYDGDSTSVPEVEFIHIHKTGALILAAVYLPAKLIALDASKLSILKKYGEAVGLAFQISDDLLDLGNGRYSKGPSRKVNPSFCHAMSPSEIKEKLVMLTDSAIQCCKELGPQSEGLQLIASYIKNRKH